MTAQRIWQTKELEYALDMRRRATLVLLNLNIVHLLDVRTPLTLGERNQVESQWAWENTHDPSGVNNYLVTPNSIETLCPDTWINDDIIDTLYEWLQEYVSTLDLPVNLYFGHTNLYRFMTSDKHQKIRKFYGKCIKKGDPNKDNVLIVPMCIDNHWINAKIRVGKLNTHGCADSRGDNFSHLGVVRELASIFRNEIDSTLVGGGSCVEVLPTIQQHNGDDCGACVLISAVQITNSFVNVKKDQKNCSNLQAAPSRGVDLNTVLITRLLSEASKPERFPLASRQREMRIKIINVLRSACIENPSLMATIASLSSSVETYCTEMETTSTWGGEPECFALAKLLGCPVIILDLPAGARQIAACHHYGEEELGTAVFLLRIGNHWITLIPEHGEAFELHRLKARSEVHTPPITRVVATFGVPISYLLYGVPGFGDCFFHCCALLEVCVEHANNPTAAKDMTLIHTRTIVLDKRQVALVKKSSARFSAAATVAGHTRVLAITADGGHAFDETPHGTLYKKELVRREMGASMGKEHAVTLIVGTGTGSEIVFPGCIGEKWVTIGVEEDKELHRGCCRTLRVLMDRGWKEPVAMRHMKAQALVSISSVTNACLYDGVKWRTSMPVDLEHLELIKMFLETDTMDEFTSTKLSWAGLQRYAAEDSRIEREVHKWFPVYITNAYGRANKMGCTMFIKKPEFRLERVPPEIVSSGIIKMLLRDAKALTDLPDGDFFELDIGTKDALLRRYNNHLVTLGGHAKDQIKNYVYIPGSIVEDSHADLAGVVIGCTQHPNTGVKMLVLTTLHPGFNTQAEPFSWFCKVIDAWAMDVTLASDPESWLEAFKLISMIKTTRSSRRLQDREDVVQMEGIETLADSSTRSSRRLQAKHRDDCDSVEGSETTADSVKENLQEKKLLEAMATQSQRIEAQTQQIKELKKQELKREGLLKSATKKAENSLKKELRYKDKTTQLTKQVRSAQSKLRRTKSMDSTSSSPQDGQGSAASSTMSSPTSEATCDEFKSPGSTRVLRVTVT